METLDEAQESGDEMMHPLLATHAAFGLNQVQTFSQGPFTLPPTMEGISTAASPTFPFCYSPRRPSFLVVTSPSSSPGYPASTAVSAPRRRSGSIGFLSRVSSHPEAIAPCAPSTSTAEGASRHSSRAPEVPNSSETPETSITESIDPETARSQSEAAPALAKAASMPASTDTAPPQCSDTKDAAFQLDAGSESKSRAWSTGDLASINEDYSSRSQREVQGYSPARRLSLPDSDIRSPPSASTSRPTLPPLSTLFPDLQRAPAPLSAVLPHAPWHDDILPMTLPETSRQGERSQTSPYRWASRTSPDMMLEHQAYPRHFSSGRRFPEPTASRGGVGSTQSRESSHHTGSRRSLSELSELSDFSSRSEPSPARPHQPLHEDPAISFHGPAARVNMSKDDSLQVSQDRSDLGLRRYPLPPPRDLRQMFRTVKPTIGSAPQHKLPRPRSESMTSPQPSERPQIRRALSWRASEEHREGPTFALPPISSPTSKAEISSPLSGFESDDAEHAHDAKQVRQTRSAESDGRSLVDPDQMDQLEWDMLSKHGRPLTRRSKVIVNDTDRRRPGYVRPIEEDRKKVRTLLDALLRAAPGNGKHLTARFPYEPKTRRVQLNKMGLRMTWGPNSTFSEAELASSTRRFRKEQCERLIETIEAGHVRFEPLDEEATRPVAGPSHQGKRDRSHSSEEAGAAVQPSTKRPRH